MLGTIWGWLVKIATWALAGFCGAKLMKSGRPDSMLSNIILGLAGGLLGSLVASLVGIGSRNFIGDLLISIAGSCLVIWLVRKFDLGKFFRK